MYSHCKDSYLNGGPYSHSQCQVHLVLRCHHDSCDVLTGIAGNGQHNDAKEGLAEPCVCTELLNATAQEPAGTAT